MHRPRVLALLIAFPILAIGCALTRGQATAIEAVDAAACAAMSAIPVVGEVAALACPGEEALLAGVLAADVAAHPAASTLPVPAAVAVATPRVTLTRRKGRGRVLVGVVAAARGPGCQAAIDAAGAGDAGSEAGK